jgi:hypothetical protein
MIFWLTTHEAGWLWDGKVDFPLFVSRRRVARYKRYRPAVVPWALDSGGFSELAKFGAWTITARQYVAEVARYANEIGRMRWAATMDMMCEPGAIHGGKVGKVSFAGTHLSVAIHQQMTTENYLECVALWPEYSDLPCPFIPTLQGWSFGEYFEHLEMYSAAGVDLKAAPVVGLGSVCRRQSAIKIALLVSSLRQEGLKLHGFGVKTAGLGAYGEDLASADSLAWSYDARYEAPLPGHTHVTCSNCAEFASDWRSDMLARATAFRLRTSYVYDLAA